MNTNKELNGSVFKGDGLWFPIKILKDHRLTFIEKILLAKIYHLDNDEHCYATNEYFAEFCSCSESSITTAIRRLKHLKLIEYLGMKHGRRYLKCLEDYDNKS